MNYTEKYHLPQWEETDRIMRTDFNDAMASIEEGVAEAKEAADALPYVTGTYVGDYTSNRKIVLGFRPSFLIVSGMTTQQGGNPSIGVTTHVMLTAGGLGVGIEHRLRLTDDGFIVYGPAEENYAYPLMNEKGRHYDYIAFR